MIAYLAFRMVNAFFGYMPYPLLAVSAHGLSFLLEYVVRYRKKLVDANLHRCFPEMSPKEIARIRRANYLNLAFILLESFKGNVMSDKELRKRYVFENPELVEAYFQKQIDIILVSAHFNNWEWGVVTFNQQLPYQTVGVYKPLKHKSINRYLDKVRSRTGMLLIPLQNTRTITEPHEPPPRMYIFIADQSPSNMKHAIWTDFLGTPTPCLHGPEKYAKQMDVPVIFASIYREKNGYYKVVFTEITARPNQTAHGEITKSFMAILEKDVLHSPGSWLWTHKRWKRVKEDNNRKIQAN